MTAQRLRGVKSSIPADFPAERLAALLEVSAALAGSLDLATVLQTSIESAVQVLGLETGAIYTLDGERLLLGAPALRRSGREGAWHPRRTGAPEIGHPKSGAPNLGT